MSHKIEVHPALLHATASQLRSTARRLRAYIAQAESQVHSLPRVEFEGTSASTLRTRFNYCIADLHRMVYVVDQFAHDLDEAATLFAQADRMLANQGYGNTSYKGSEFLEVLVEPRILQNYMHQNGLSGLANFIDFVVHSRTSGAALELIGEMSDKHGLYVDILQAAMAVNEAGLTEESVSEAFTQLLIRGAISQVPHVAAAMLINAGVQFGGAVVIDGNTFLRDLVAPDSSLTSYAIMTDGLNRFGQVLDKSNLNNVVDSLAAVGSDILFEPMLNSKPPSGSQLDSWLSRNLYIAEHAPIDPFTRFALYSLRNPEHFYETGRDLADLVGDTLDVVTYAPQLPGAVMEMQVDMGIGLIQRGVEVTLGPEVATQTGTYAVMAEQFSENWLRPQMPAVLTGGSGEYDIGELSRRTFDNLFGNGQHLL